MTDLDDIHTMHKSSIHDLSEHLESKLTLDSGGRQIVAIAGPPASGKSTLMASLLEELKARMGNTHVAGLPMDGFHLDNVILDREGWRARKGAPHTFDVGGLNALLGRIKNNESPVYAPDFDRASDLSRNCAIRIEESHKVVLVEGNYLLLNTPHWHDLAKWYSLSISLMIDEAVLRRRLISRWEQHGLSTEDAVARAEENDMPNAKLVLENSNQADIVYCPETTS